jgi:tRNA-dihydrouridine synthase
METGRLPEPPSFNERIDTALRHLRMAIAIKGERRAVLEMRKHYIAYLKYVPNSRQMRHILMKPETLAEAEDVLHSLVYFQEEKPADLSPVFETAETVQFLPDDCCF